MPDIPQNPYTDPSIITELLRRGGRAVAPSATSLIGGEPDPNQHFSMQPYPSGKLPQQADPRIEGAALDAGNVAGHALGLLGGGTGFMGDLASGFISPAQAAEKKPQGKGPAVAPGAIAPAAPNNPEAQPEGGGIAGGRPHFTPEQVQEIATLKKDIKDLSAQQQTEIQNVGRSRVGATATNFQNQITAKQNRLDKLLGDMDSAQQLYDKQGQPLSMRDPETVDALRMGAFKLAAGHGAARGLFKKNPIMTALGGGLEALGGAFAPTFLDLFKPEDTQAFKQSHHNLTNEDYYKQVIAPDVLFGGGALSTIGHGLGRTAREGLDQSARGIKNFVDWRRSLKAPPNPPGGGGPPPLPGGPGADLADIGIMPKGGPAPTPNFGLGPIDPNSPAAISQILRQGSGGRWHRPSGAFTKTGKPAND